MAAPMTPVARPERLHGREAEWDRLVAFVDDPRPGPAIGIVTGPHGHGKSFLLRALARATGGFYFGGQPAAEAETLRSVAREYASHAHLARPPHWTGWREALLAMAATGSGPATVLVLDGLPELVRQSPGLPAAISDVCRSLRRGPADSAPLRLVLCGSTTPVMKRLLSASTTWVDDVLEVAPLDFRRARELWGIGNRPLALRVHAVVGSSPAFRFDPAGDRPPQTADDFDPWICRNVLTPRLPLFWKATHLLDGVTDTWDLAACHSTVAAVASGRTMPGEIADWLDRPATDVPHILAHLTERGLISGEPDAFHPGLVHYRVSEPLLAFDHAVIRPNRFRLADADDTEIERIWQDARPTFERGVAGPHFAQICREWAARFAPAGTFGAAPASVLSGSLPHTPGHPTGVDVVVRGRGDGRPGPLLSLGVARWTDPVSTTDLERLRVSLVDLAELGEDIGRTRLACYGAAGFSPGLRNAEADGEVLLVSPEELYDSPEELYDDGT
ncbi:AAA family ATPase [Streptomyces griseus]|uniref:AAA family ATPase n=1 Tax=Streptomyces griseus TaxID=1911 RepID=UPI0020C7DBB6|nr:ATP-binding protein [Streptomyces griseus]